MRSKTKTNRHSLSEALELPFSYIYLLGALNWLTWMSSFLWLVVITLVLVLVLRFQLKTFLCLTKLIYRRVRKKKTGRQGAEIYWDRYLLENPEIVEISKKPAFKPKISGGKSIGTEILSMKFRNIWVYLTRLSFFSENSEKHWYICYITFPKIQTRIFRWMKIAQALYPGLILYSETRF